MRYGVAAAELIAAGKYGNMVCMRDGRMNYVNLEEAIEGNKLVDPNGEMVKAARNLGISFGN